MKNYLLAILIGLLLAPGVFAQSEPAAGNILFILDGSGSMWGQVEGKNKIVIAKEVMTGLVQELPPDIRAGLEVYGHRSKGDCNDIEVVVPVGSGNRQALIDQIEAITPRGKTPITQAFQQAADQLRALEDETTVVLVSDGKETCEGDPCTLVRELREQGIKIKVHVVGFDVTHDESEQLVCIADAGGGTYFSAQNTSQLKAALTEVKQVVVEEAVRKSGEEYQDAQGNRVLMRLGKRSFADRVHAFKEGFPVADARQARNPELTLSAPDYVQDGPEESTTLGCGGTLELQFVDNGLVDFTGDDLHIFEVGPDVEPMALAISKDGSNWVDLGRISGGKAAVDISSVAQPDDVFHYVRLTDLRQNCNSRYPGADIDAVAAVNSIAVDSAAQHMASSGMKILFEDHFERDKLGEHYEVFGYDPNRLAVTGGKLLIVAAGLETNFPYLKEMIDGDFTATVKLHMQLDSGNAAGIAYVVDDKNHLNVYLAAVDRDGKVSLQPGFYKKVSDQVNDIRREPNKIGDRKLIEIMPSPDTWYLQLQRSGVKYSARISTDGVDWMDIGIHTLLDENGKLGFFAHSYGGVENPVEFDDFVITAE